MTLTLSSLVCLGNKHQVLTLLFRLDCPFQVCASTVCFPTLMITGTKFNMTARAPVLNLVAALLVQ